MGSGKSTLGKRLARKLNFSFIDLDEEIERKENRLIRKIFEHEGEEYFRKIEAECLRGLLERDDLVVSTGGGTPCFHGNMEWMNQEGTTIYLMLSPAALVTRLSGRTTFRPLLKGMKEGEMLPFIMSRLKDREVFYKKSRIIIDGLKPDLKEIVNQIM